MNNYLEKEERSPREVFDDEISVLEEDIYKLELAITVLHLEKEGLLASKNALLLGIELLGAREDINPYED